MIFLIFFYFIQNDALSRVEIQESERKLSGCNVLTYGVLAKSDGATNIDYHYDVFDNKFVNNPYLIDASLIFNVLFVIICITGLCVMFARIFKRKRTQKPVKETPYKVVDQEKEICDTDDDDQDNEEIVGLQEI